MKELDLLKKDWQKSTAFEQVSEGQIYKMLHMKSSSVVKWILIVGILEFVILNGIAFFLNDKSYDEFLRLHPFIDYSEKFNYLVSIVFIYLFYRNYKAISVLHSSKILIEHILKTRKIVTYYIYWNIIISGVAGSLSFIEGWNSVENSTADKRNHDLEVNFITVLFAATIIMAVIWLFYKLLYGRFLSKLNENYIELQKIDL